MGKHHKNNASLMSVDMGLSNNNNLVFNANVVGSYTYWSSAIFGKGNQLVE